MCVILNNHCPVCGNPPLSKDAIDCNRCGFRNAHIRLFAGSKSLASWKRQAEEARSARKAARRKAFASADRLCLGGNCLAYLKEEQHQLIILRGNGILDEVENVLQFHSSERNQAVVYRDGKVGVWGSNDYNQCDTKSWTEIQFVLSGPNCTYGVTRSGEIRTAGLPVDGSVKSWKQIRKLACSSKQIVGLKDNGSVIAAGNILSSEIHRIESWRDVIDMAASAKGTVALHTDGTVSYAGQDDDLLAAVTQWQDIIAIAIDNHYVYGINSDGTLRLAGTCRPILDRGRSGAAAWKNLMAISSNALGVCAVNESGELLFAGSISGDIQGIKTNWKNKIQEMIKGG